VRTIRILVLLLCGVAMWPAAGRAQSQATAGQIAGQVVDNSGAVLPGATVTITSADTGFTRTVATGDDGLYTLAAIPPGTYEIKAELAGFQTATIAKTVVTVGSNLSVNITLPVAGVAENVTVTSRAAAVETNSSRQTNTLNSKAIENLPINGRRFQDFVSLTPTAQVDNSRGQISLAGQRGINSNISIDGADYNQPFFGGIRGGERSNFAFTIPQEAIGEFQVVSSGFSAEFGRSSGGLVNAVTKAGTNTMHGTAFYLNRPKDLAAKNAFDQDAAFDQAQFGGSLGGPIAANKLFFFGAYEQQTFNAPRVVLFDQLVGQSPSANTAEAFNFYKSLEEPFENTNDAWAWLGRVDAQVSDAHRINVRYNGSRNTADNGAGVGGRIFPTTNSALSNDGTEKNDTNTVVGQLTSVLSPKMLLEVRGQYSKENRPRLANSETPTFGNTVGTFGARSFLPTTQNDWRAQTAANVTWTQGSHNAKVGFEYNHTAAEQVFGFNQFGAFNISGTRDAVLEIMTLGGTTANRFDSTTVTYNRQIGNRELTLAQDEAAFFVQDAWRIKPNLTINAGLRWEGQYNPTPDVSNTPVYNAVNGFAFPLGGRSVDPGVIPDATNQWSPRVGLAYDPFHDGKTVIRGHAGIYYARTPSIVFSGPMNNFRLPAGDVSLQLPLRPPTGNPNDTVYEQFKLIGIDMNTYQLNNLPVLTPEQVQSIGAALGLVPDPFLGAALLTTDPDFRNPQGRQYGFGVERELMTGLVVGAEFQQVKTKYLERNRNLNLPIPVIRPTDPAQRPFWDLVNTARPIASLGAVTVRESTARSDFRALTLSSKYRTARYQVDAFYTLSKSESDDDNERDSGGFQHENAFDLSSEYGPANLDRRHQFQGNATLFLPFDIIASSGFAARSGRPIEATMGSDANGDRGGPDRPFSAPGVPFHRNAFRNNAIYDVNLRLQKGIALGQERKLFLSAEFFNVFNFENLEYAGSAVTNYCSAPVPLDCGFGAPTNPNFLSLTDNNQTSATFGQLLTGNTPGQPFQMQLGVRFTF
jgi:outer membrane receptor for ferrienterochelin and colicin